MSKRFTDTDKWSHPWYRKLKPKHKCAWQYACDYCDFAGVWIADFEVMSLRVGEDVEAEEFEEIFKDKILKISSDKYFIKGFPVFQYADREGKISPKNNIAMNALQILKKFGIDLSCLIAPPKGDSPTPQGGVKDKEEDKAKDKVKEKEKAKEEEKAKENIASKSNASPENKKQGKRSPYSLANSIWSIFSHAGLNEVMELIGKLDEDQKKVMAKFGSAGQIINCPGQEVTSLKIRLQDACKEVLNSS